MQQKRSTRKQRAKVLRILEGQHGRVEVDAEDWCKILLTLEDCGWRPEQSRLAYLAPNAVVSEVDSMNLVKASDNLLDAAADNPAILARQTNINKLAEVVNFCRSGGFRILLLSLL